MGKKIYVGNLPFSASNETLSEIFVPFGHVESSKIVMDRDSGRSKGFGFVEMTNEDEAATAILKLHGSDYGGRKLTVNEARPSEKKDPSRNSTFSPRGERTGYNQGMGQSEHRGW